MSNNQPQKVVINFDLNVDLTAEDPVLDVLEKLGHLAGEEMTPEELVEHKTSWGEILKDYSEEKNK